MVIDTHLHLGVDLIYERSSEETEIINAADDAGVEKMIVHPAHTHLIDAAIEHHNRIAKFSGQTNHRVFGVACINPYYGEDIFLAEVNRCIQDLGFIGIVLDTYIHSCNPCSKTAQFVFEAARMLKVPLVVTTGFSKFSMPILLYDRAKEFSEVPIVLTRAGSHFLQHEAIILARECSNVYLEPSLSTSNSRSIRQLVKAIGARRIMMGSGWHTEMKHMIWKFRTDPQTGLADNELEWCLGRTASEVFGIKINN